MEVCTIGFTRKHAAEFFGALRTAGIRRLVDVRLLNDSHLAGFARRDDLAFFLKEICGAEYVHEPRLAPTKEILDGYRRKTIAWDEYEQRFLALLAERRVEEVLHRDLLGVPAVLLCGEPKPDRCHRRLAAEYLQAKWGPYTIRHL